MITDCGEGPDLDARFDNINSEGLQIYSLKLYIYRLLLWLGLILIRISFSTVHSYLLTLE